MRLREGQWVPELSGWGLRNLDSQAAGWYGRLSASLGSTRATFDPVSVITSAEVDMTEWEVRDFAVQVVRADLERRGLKVTSAQGNPGVDPSLWFAGAHGPEWVVVRAARYPQRAAPMPSTLPRVREQLASRSVRGHFASVAISGAGRTGPNGRLIRGGGCHVLYNGLQPLTP